MDAARLAILDAMGVTAWVARDAPSPASNAPGTPDAPAGLDWSGLEDAVRGCRQCGLCESRTQTVFGTGDRKARLMVIGEAPGAEEDRQGEPFVGRAGQLLNSMLAAAGFARGEVFIANVLKCLRYNALVQLENSTWERIGRLVRSHYAGRVMSVDVEGRIV